MLNDRFRDLPAISLSAFIRAVATSLIILALGVNLTGCFASNTSSPNHSVSSKSTGSTNISSEIEVPAYSDFETSYPDLYQYSDRTTHENTYNEAKVISYSDAADYVGKEVTVEGRITSAYYASSSKGSPYFLNFGDNNFCAVIWEENQDDVNTTDLDYLVRQTKEFGKIDQKARVSGVVSTYKGEPQIVVREGSQIAEHMKSDGSSIWVSYITLDEMTEYDDLLLQKQIERSNLRISE